MLVIPRLFSGDLFNGISIVMHQAYRRMCETPIDFVRLRGDLFGNMAYSWPDKG